MVAHTFNTSTWGVESGNSEFQANLVFKVSPCLKNKTKLKNKEMQQLMGEDAGTHTQILGGIQGNLQKRGRKDYKSQRGWGHKENMAYRVS